MKPERTFVAERALAQHCPELLREGPRPQELLPRLSAMAPLLAAKLASGLARMNGGEAPGAVCSPPRECLWQELAGEIAPLAANCVLAVGEAPFLMSIEAKAVLRMIDRAYGGRGTLPAQMPEAFPLSAELLVARLETLFADALSASLGNGLPISALQRDGSIARLAPFDDATELAVQTIDIAEADGTDWQVSLAFPLESLSTLFGSAGFAPSDTQPARAMQDPLAQPFADLPLELRAVLVDMAMPVSALAELTPGAMLPVAVARAVPIQVGGRTVACGTVGEKDDRIAIQISHAFNEQGSHS